MIQFDTPFGITVNITKHIKAKGGYHYFMTDCYERDTANYSKAVVYNDKAEKGTKAIQYGRVYLHEADEFKWKKQPDLEGASKLLKKNGFTVA